MKNIPSATATQSSKKSAELEALININPALQHGEHAEAAQHRNSYKQPEKYKTMQNITEQRLLGS